MSDEADREHIEVNAEVSAEDGDVLKAPHLAAYLAERREKLAEDARYQFDIHDVAYFFNARGRDISNSPQDPDEERHFRDMARVVEDVRAGLSTLTPQQQKDIISYLTNDFYKVLDRQASEPETTDPELEVNMQIFESLIRAVEKQKTASEDEPGPAKPDPGDAKDTARKADTKAEVAYEQPPLPEYAPGAKLGAFFDGIHGQTEAEIGAEITSLDTVQAFVAAEIEDIEEQESQQLPLITAVKGAKEFLEGVENVEKERESGKMVVVVTRDGEVVAAGWEEDISPDVEGEKYQFNPSVKRKGETPTFDEYERRCTDYSDLLNGTNEREGLYRASQRVQELIDNPGMEMPKEELLPIRFGIDLHANYLDQVALERLKKQVLQGQVITKKEFRRRIDADPEKKAKYAAIEHQFDILERLAQLVKERELPKRKKRLFKSTGRLGKAVRKVLGKDSEE